MATRIVKKPKKPAAAKVRRATESLEPDEFSAAGGMPSVAAMPGNDRSGQKRDIRELSWAEFDQLVQGLARDAAKRFKPDAVVGLVHGGVFVGGAVASALKVEFFPMRVTRRSRDQASVAPDDFSIELRGRRVLIVDDIASSGDSLEFATKLARAGGVKQCATAALVARPGRYEPTFAALGSDEFFVFPWDYAPMVADARFASEPERVVVKPARGSRRRTT
jgi:uncharacterized protein